MSLFDTLFGGKDRSAQRHTLAQNERSADVINRNADRAREDVMRLFPAAQHTMQQGVQQALDLYGQSIPQQMGAFQQGNMQAQDAQLRGLSGIQQALMGQPLDLSYGRTQGLLSPIQYDPSFAQQQAPQFVYGDQAGIQGGPQQNIQQYLQQLFGGM